MTMEEMEKMNKGWMKMDENEKKMDVKMSLTMNKVDEKRWMIL